MSFDWNLETKLNAPSDQARRVPTEVRVDFRYRLYSRAMGVRNHTSFETRRYLGLPRVGVPKVDDLGQAVQRLENRDRHAQSLRFTQGSTEDH